ncbi:hypothetical protein [Vibrio phage LP.2]|nr:hypothetical protein [Vibrio phage LP.2]
MMKHYTQLSREAQEEFDRFEWEEKLTVSKGWFGLTAIALLTVVGLIVKFGVYL